MRAMYSDTQQWVLRSEELGVKFAFCILYAIWSDLFCRVGWDINRVHLARKAITEVYMNGLNRQGERIDWTAADMQCSYMLRFFLIHCQFIPRLLQGSSQILHRFPAGNVNIIRTKVGRFDL